MRFSRRPLTPLAVWGYGRYCPVFDAPLDFLGVLRQLHDGQMGQVKGNGSLSDSFLISNGARQGCVLAPFLFSIYFIFFFSVMMADAKEALIDGYLHLLPHR